MNDAQARLAYGRVRAFASAVRGCSLISTVFGSKKCGGGGRETGKRGGGEGGGGWSRQSVAFATLKGERVEREGREGQEGAR